MSVFAKTAKGLDALKDLNSGMPRRMRTVLWCVNGQTSTSTLIRSLTSVGDVKELMRGLIAEGFIERVHKNTPPPAVVEAPLNVVAPSTTKVDTRWARSGWNMGFPNQGVSTAQ
jgi:hypothetical protein